MLENPQRQGAIWQATFTIAFIRDEITGKNLLHQLWIDDLGLQEWRLVPVIDPLTYKGRNPAVVGVVPMEQE